MKKRRRAYKRSKPQHSVTLFTRDDSGALRVWLAMQEPDFSRIKNAIKRSHGIPQRFGLGVVMDDEGAHPVPILKRMARHWHNA